MKANLRSFAGGFFLVLFGVHGLAQIPMLPQTVTMGPGYANEVYYQFTTLNTYSTPRTAWDLSFCTQLESAAILINDGNVETLWSFAWADTSGWAVLDTFGLYTLEPLYNDPDDWENGAFNRYATGYPDYGWGVFDPSTHIITGDSLFVMQLADGSFKKVWIVEKNTAQNTYLFRYANLDGSDYQEITLDCSPYVGKNMVGFNMQTNLPVDYQPVKESWDILFTKYMAWHPTGAPVIVTGVLSNPAIQAKKFYPVDPEFNDWESAPWDSSRSTIGWDWKWFDLTSFTYFIEDSMVFYVHDQMTNVYRLKFTGFEGTSTGVIDFGIALILAAGTEDQEFSGVHVNLYPNPATEIIHVTIESAEPANAATSITLLDPLGRPVRTGLLPPGEHHTTWNIQALSPGAYILIVTSGKEHSISKFFKL